MTLSSPPDITRSPLILVLDDDPHECTLLGTLIEDTWPHCAVRAGPPTAALLRDLTYPDGLRPDLLIVEQDMPGCMGLDILRAVRATPGGQTLPVVILSADEDPRGAAAAHHAGASAYRVKPTTPGEYRSMLADLLLTFLPNRAD
ncbi:response regulator [Deinococcus soli (ex Cha et al. 2016)]|uniref:CheY-like chemotaxis protein n=2 Tax=Deinococcus soli (ex Cha et al. 2016) TaxID=1309411 RepID=A0ACC6KE57_9DEIO|nr:response regulator [Deinococcus soli (ex Cha et al. 2016)]MDR6217193.1 CheY-like chemotaxis protein [Deinococcus soli (ex Cha et al. 2016)]MDR6326502.1 CheY-like chemotaxis protein [Deinococcus soli (ex Cha et al. 2016)]MDR6750771.1 CheY-like chemotaxis protein [Deinococcus soli (ex Cha et al. 2016)]